MTDQSTAIIIFAFNRPEKLKRLVESLASCPEFGAHPLFIFIDGARTPNEQSAVEATFAFAESVSHPLKTVCRRERNLGLRQSLRDGISTVLNRHDAVIVLEDDLIVGSHALDYMLRGLGQYRTENRVASICAYALSERKSGRETDLAAHFLPMTHPWGWATWRDRWQTHTESLGSVQQQVLPRSRAFRRAMNVSGLRNYAQMLRLAERGIVNSWWIYWHRDAVVRHQVSLFPAQTHVINAGIDGSGTHASRWNFLRKCMPRRNLSQKKETLSQEVSVDFATLDQIVASHEARYHRLIDTLGLIRRYLKRIMGG
ncbi:MAG: glycosyltransferase [Paracoccaceae bacterium]